MNTATLITQMHYSLLLFVWLVRVPLVILVVGIWYFDLGRVLQDVWRFAMPLWILSLIAINLVAPWGVKQGWNPHIFHSIGLIPTLAVYGSALLLWAVLNYFSIGPTQWFAFLTQLEIKTILAWRSRRSTTLGSWIGKELERAEERRKFLLPATLYRGVKYTAPQRDKATGSGRNSYNPYDTPMSRFRDDTTYRQTPPVYETHEASQETSPLEDMANGRVRWRDKGKQYTANPDALLRIVGMESVIREIQEAIVQPLQNAELLRKFDVPIKTGMLLYGPPGNGKTALARAVAESLGLYFVSVRGSDLQGTLVGATEQNITNLFLEAQQHAPAIIFIDEIDAIGSKRGGMNPYHDAQLNQLLAELDGFVQRDKVFVIAATNRLEALDEALVRPGRLGTKIYVPNPSASDIRAMWARWTLRHHLKFAIDADKLPKIHLLFEGASGAEVSQVAENLRLKTAIAQSNRTKFVITLDDIVREIEKVRGKAISVENLEAFRGA